MRVAIHQPQYIPWLGYLDKLDSADVFIVLDTVQFKKHEWQNRNRIRTKEGWQWLTVPIIDRFPERIDQVEINAHTDWARKHRQALRLQYGRSPHWEPLGPALLALLERPWARLCDLNVAVLDLLCEQLGLSTRRLLASGLTAREDPTDRSSTSAGPQEARSTLPANPVQSTWISNGSRRPASRYRHRPIGTRPIRSNIRLSFRICR